MACETAAFGIHRDGAPQNEVALTVRDRGYATTQPAILVVQPGTYQVDRASCFSPRMVLEQMNVLPYCLGKVGEKSGEVVYLGTLDTEILDFKTAMSDNQKFWNTIFLTGRENIESKYVSFQFKDQSDEVLERLRDSHPDLAAKLTIRRPPVYVTKGKALRARWCALIRPIPTAPLPKTEGGGPPDGRTEGAGAGGCRATASADERANNRGFTGSLRPDAAQSRREPN